MRWHHTAAVLMGDSVPVTQIRLHFKTPSLSRRHSAISPTVLSQACDISRVKYGRGNFGLGTLFKKIRSSEKRLCERFPHFVQSSLYFLSTHRGPDKYTKYTAIRRNDAHSERQAEILAFSQINVSFLRELLCKNMRREKQKRGFFCTAGRAEKCPLGFFLWRSPHQKVDKLVNGGHGACSVLLSHRTASVYVLAPTYCVMLPRELSLPWNHWSAQALPSQRFYNTLLACDKLIAVSFYIRGGGVRSYK